MSDETKRICLDCRSKYELSEPDQEFFERRGLQLPRRCRACRRLRRMTHQAATAPPPYLREVR